MIHKRTQIFATLPFLVSLLAGNAFLQLAHADNTRAMDSDKARIVEYWTKQRIADAMPRDLVIDHRGLGYLRKPDGTFSPYGHQIAVDTAPQQVTPFAKPSGPGGGGEDSTPPLVSNMNPGPGEIIGVSHTFSATVTDASGVKSVSFVIQYPNGTTTQSFSASMEANTDTWSTTLQGFTDGDWSWRVTAKDAAGRGGNSTTSETINFSVNTAGSGSGSTSSSGGTDTISNAAWTAGGAVQTAAGRIYFEMPANSKRKSPWNGYVCSGTVIDDATANRSVILTAAHCVYDDVNKAFARNVLFIPDQADTSGSGTDLNCNNDPLGCWTPAFGVVDSNWTNATFPDNIPWDYAYYVVEDSGAHAGPGSTSALDVAAGTLPVSFQEPYIDDGEPGGTSIDFTHALGYSYSEDPNLMYCAEDMTTEGAYNWWLASCGLSGGSSGGPWTQPMDTSLGTGPVISVNSWGYTTSPGMAGPKLSGSSAACLLTTATSRDWLSVSSADGEAGIAEVCP
jgi:hypothetical protein